MTTIPEYHVLSTDQAEINTGAGWKTVWRNDLEKALHRVRADETNPGVASPKSGVAPLDESQLTDVLDLMDRHERDQWNLADDLIAMSKEA